MKLETCKIEGCTQTVVARGLCSLHYNRIRRGCTDMRPEKMACWDTRQRKEHGLCKIEKCNGKHYAKGLCKYHYSNLIKTGNPIRKRSYKNKKMVKCIVDGCDNYAISSSKYGMCTFHRERKLNGIDLNRPKGNKGENNTNWKGGVSFYPDHYQLKKNRLLVLNSAGWICAKCGGKANSVIHKDGSRDNHEIANLEARCNNCIDQKRAKKKTSKFIRIYGNTLKEIAVRLNVADVTVLIWHRKNMLADKIATANR